SEGREVARSAFVDQVAEDAQLETDAPEQVLLPQFPIVRDESALAQARAAAAREPDRAAREARVPDEGAAAALTPHNGLIEDPVLRDWLAERYGESYEWSATQLETLAKCPWHWFAARL